MSATAKPLAEIVWPYIERSIERLVTLAGELSAEELAWRPPAPEANSIATLAGHTLGNAEDNLLGTLCGQAVSYERAADFLHPQGDPVAIRARWERLRAEFATCLPSLTDERLRDTVAHPRRGSTTGVEVLLVVARHAAEHLAHAELTRDLMLAGRATIGAPREGATS